MLFLCRILALKSGPAIGAQKRPRIWTHQPGTTLCGTRLRGLDRCPATLARTIVRPATAHGLFDTHNTTARLQAQNMHKQVTRITSKIKAQSSAEKPSKSIYTSWMSGSSGRAGLPAETTTTQLIGHDCPFPGLGYMQDAEPQHASAGNCISTQYDTDGTFCKPGAQLQMRFGPVPALFH